MTHSPAIAAIAVAMLAATAPDVRAQEDLARRHACTACHLADKRLVGPGWKEIAARHKDREDRVAYLAGKIRGGSQGIWGPVPMPANPGVAEADAQAIARWIAGQ